MNRGIDHALRATLTAEEQRISDRMFTEYCSRPQHRDRLTAPLVAALRAAANRYAKHGNPPNRNQRLAYRRWKKQRKRELAIAIYGDPVTAAEILRIQQSRPNDHSVTDQPVGRKPTSR